VTPSFSPDTLLTLTGSRYLALVPIRWTDYRRVAATPSPRVTIMGIVPALHGTLVSYNPELRVLSGRTVVIATVQLDDAPPDLMPGMLLPCRIRCSPVTAVSGVRAMLASVAATAPLRGVR